MTNKDRIQIRIRRDKYRREQKRQKKFQEIDNFDNVITWKNYIDALKKCQKGVSWKNSVQKYKYHAIEEIYDTMNQLKEGKLPQLKQSHKIVICERGKERTIVPIVINDRMTQRVLCDSVLVPITINSLIKDNGASLPNKGVQFARQEVDKFLRQAIKQWGTDFYVLEFDFKSYFESIPHDTCLKVIQQHFKDPQIVNLVMKIIHSYTESDLKREFKNKSKEQLEQELLKLNNDELIGICLGSQISQILALLVPNKFDHYIKDKKRCKYYIRYMDDGIVFARTKEELRQLLQELQIVVEELGLKFNMKKTNVVKITKGFTFMKVHYKVLKNGTLLKTLTRAGKVRERRKLKKFAIKIQNDEMDLRDVYNSLQAYISHTKIAKAYHTRKNILALYKKLFGYTYLKELKR